MTFSNYWRLIKINPSSFFSSYYFQYQEGCLKVLGHVRPGWGKSQIRTKVIWNVLARFSKKSIADFCFDSNVFLRKCLNRFPEKWIADFCSDSSVFLRKCLKRRPEKSIADFCSGSNVFLRKSLNRRWEKWISDVHWRADEQVGWWMEGGGKGGHCSCKVIHKITYWSYIPLIENILWTKSHEDMDTVLVRWSTPLHWSSVPIYCEYSHESKVTKSSFCEFFTWVKVQKTWMLMLMYSVKCELLWSEGVWWQSKNIICELVTWFDRVYGDKTEQYIDRGAEVKIIPDCDNETQNDLLDP